MMSSQKNTLGLAVSGAINGEQIPSIEMIWYSPSRTLKQHDPQAFSKGL